MDCLLEEQSRMESSRRGGEPGPRLLSAQCLGSEELTLAFASFSTLVFLAVPLMLSCYQHLAAGHVTIGCSYGFFGVAVAAVSGWKFATVVQRGRRKLAGSGPRS